MGLLGLSALRGASALGLCTLRTGWLGSFRILDGAMGQPERSVRPDRPASGFDGVTLG